MSIFDDASLASPELVAHAKRELLVYGVRRAIQCPVTGELLDWRTAVYADGNGITLVCTGAAWDEMEDAGYTQRIFKGEPVEFIDGRVLWQGKEPLQ